ncbi:GNAT family N-acetyltransferase [Saccharopolyspora gloriosae]|uniref:Ribosomal-protein-alanine N-acetyltransferase n=1 Tax=Saccharopolyspora gloriosae TaxID=455344 RepID=A0A840NAU8_9PSEU|nr:ribosomal-protein-alanine N-acetyltransferase [Saccharopolyspora gloriosae]
MSDQTASLPENPCLVTERLVLRPWEPADFDAVRAWHADPVVMRHLGGVLDSARSDATVRRWTAELESKGFGMLAVCPADGARPIGTVGLGLPAFDSHFTPCVEIGWRLDRGAWGRGYATEAARAVLRDGFDRLGLAEIVAFTARQNTGSERVMNRLGMRYDPSGDFVRRFRPDGPEVPSVLWRVRAGDLGEDGALQENGDPRKGGGV